MLERAGDGLGGENAGGAEASTVTNQLVLGTVATGSLFAATGAGDDRCPSGTKKSCPHAADVSWAGALCWWHGGAAGLEPSAAHDATHCAALKINAMISKATKW